MVLFISKMVYFEKQVILIHLCMSCINILERTATMESSYLKTFVEVVRTGSFTKASEKLFITQSAVSRRIQYMEKQYDCSLIDRSGPLLKQTEKGQRLFDKAMKIIEIEQELELDLKPAKIGGSLSFVSTPTFGTVFLPQIMGRFVRGEHSATSLKFFQDVPEGIRESLRRGTFEIAVIEHCADFDLSEFETVPLQADKMVFAAANNIEITSSQPQLEELFEYSFLSCGSACCTRVLLERNLISRGYSKEKFKQFIEISELDMLLQSLVSGMGIAFLPLVLISNFVEKGQLKTYQFDDFEHYRNRTLIVPSKAMDCGLACRFAEQIVTYFDESDSTFA